MEKYPKIKREDKLCCKLTDIQIKEIQSLHKKGKSMKELSRMFKVAPITIKYWVDPEYREKDKQRVLKKTRELREDPITKKKMYDRRAEQQQNARERIPELGAHHKKELIVLNKKVTVVVVKSKLNKLTK